MNCSHRITPNKMEQADKAHLQQTTAHLIDQLHEIDEVQTLIPQKAVVLTSLFVGVMLLLVSAHNFGFIPQIGNVQPLPHPMIGVIAGVINFLAGLYFWHSRRLSRWAIQGYAYLEISLYLMAVVFNGHKAALFLPAVLALTHILLASRRALQLSIALIGLTVVLWPFRFPEIDAGVVLRMLTSSALVMSLLQLLTRHTQQLNSVTFNVTQGLKELTDELSTDLTRTQDERDRAEMTDLSTGLLNVQGFERAAKDILSTAEAGKLIPLVRIRLETLMDSLALLDATEHHHMTVRLVERLRRVFGPESLIGRIGKNDFAVLLPAVSQLESELLQSLLALQGQLGRPLITGSHAAFIEPQMGISLWPRDGDKVSSLTHNAEIALQLATESEQSVPLFYDHSMKLTLVERGRMAEALKQAIENDEFELYYQPIISLGDGKIRKAEALIRWHHPEEGLLLPNAFIPLAESTGIIMSLTDWVLKQSIRQVTEWRQHLDPHFTISVNMPPAYLEACALNPAETRRQLSTLSVPAGSIVLEITENAFLTVTPAIQEVFSVYKTLGFRIALDDFGVGYSNFAQLTTLPLDFIKIDKSLIQPITTSAKHWTLCKTIINVGQTLGFEAIAEGLENEQHVELIRSAGCHFGQGYVFSKPLPVGKFMALVASRQSI